MLGRRQLLTSPKKSHLCPIPYSLKRRNRLKSFMGSHFIVFPSKCKDGLGIFESWMVFMEVDGEKSVFDG